MKNLLLSTMALLSFNFANSQVIWQENFEATTGTAIPATFTQTTLATDGGYKSGTGASLSSAFFEIPDHSRILATNDDECNCDKSSDILITPSFSLSGYSANVYLQMDVFFYGATYQSKTETAEVQYSTNGGTTWTQLTTITGANGWRTVVYPLTPVLGQSNVKLAIKYHDGTGWLYGLALDNMKVFVPPAKDMAVTNAIPGGRYLAGNATFQATVQSFGMDPVNTVTLNYQVGTQTPVSKNFTLGTPLNFTQSQTLSFDPASIPAGNHNDLKVWVSNVNGTGADANAQNDTAKYTGMLYVASQTTPRNVLIEEFTSSTCPPCASLNATFDPLLNSNNPNTGGRVNVVKYQMNYPNPGNDPSYNADGEARESFYGVLSIPFTVMNGTSSMPSKTQGAIDSAKNKPAFANMTVSISRTGTTYNGTVNFTPYISVSSGSNLALYQVYMQKYYNYPGATTSQKDYYHVMRKMMPNGKGKIMTSLTGGVAVNESSQYTFNTVALPAQNSYNLWSTPDGVVEFVAFIQDTTTGEILQSASANVTVGLVDLADNQSIGIYPNPANDYTVIATKLNASTKVSLLITDLYGRVVYKKEETTIPAGQQEIAINTDKFAGGAYTVIIKTPHGDLKEKLIVQH